MLGTHQVGHGRLHLLHQLCFVFERDHALDHLGIHHWLVGQFHLEPRVIHRVIQRYPVLWIFHQQFGYQVFGRIRHVFELIPLERELSVRDVLENVLVVSAPKGWVARQEHLHADSQGPDVAFLVLATPQHFRRDLLRCSFDALLFEIFDFVAETEVNDFHVGFEGLFRQQKIFGLQISVTQPLSMTVLERAEYLPHLFLDVTLLYLTQIHDLLEDFSAFAEFHDEVLVIFVVEVVLKLDDVGVVQITEAF